MNVVQVAELDFLAVSGPSAKRWYRYLPTSDEKRPRLQAHRRHLDLMPFSEFVCLQYRTLEVEALWCSIVPFIYFGTIEWHQVVRVIPQFGGVQNRPHPALACTLGNQIPVEATQRQSGPHSARPDVPHVSDNRRPGRRMMLGTRTTARDWQWLEDMMAEDASAG
ncbi:hypothetical protein PIB30_002038 [Stylosanthes scabra]|uniref:Uncharacterized protein n=1 Tax=Stylosanthes scabra TaxID=79078 RepID=A0ABU6Q2R6_9FABA|nr:hypothetical protein [Stylosanthes scabra]